MSDSLKKKSKKNHYFTIDTERAIIAYCQTECLTERTKLYIEHIQPAFNELVDKIVYTYKFTSLENIDSHKDECKIWLTTILGKFKPENGAKAFSYFSVVTKNWFTHRAKQQTKKNKREIEYDSMIREVEALSSENSETFIQQQEDAEFWMFLMKEIESWKDLKLRENERKVLDAIQTLFNNIDDIDITRGN